MKTTDLHPTRIPATDARVGDLIALQNVHGDLAVITRVDNVDGALLIRTDTPVRIGVYPTETVPVVRAATLRALTARIALAAYSTDEAGVR